MGKTEASRGVSMRLKSLKTFYKHEKCASTKLKITKDKESRKLFGQNVGGKMMKKVTARLSSENVNIY